MTVLLIILAYLIIVMIELPPLIIDKKRRETLFFLIVMCMALTESIFIVTAADLPSVASIIKKILSPILKLKI